MLILSNKKEKTQWTYLSAVMSIPSALPNILSRDNRVFLLTGKLFSAASKKEITKDR